MPHTSRLLTLAVLASAAFMATGITVNRVPVTLQLLDTNDLSDPECRSRRPAWLSSPVAAWKDGPVRGSGWVPVTVQFSVVRQRGTKASPAPLDLELTAWKEGRRWPQARSTVEGLQIRCRDRTVEVGMHVWNADLRPDAPPVILHVDELNTNCPALNATTAILSAELA